MTVPYVLPIRNVPKAPNQRLPLVTLSVMGHQEERGIKTIFPYTRESLQSLTDLVHWCQTPSECFRVKTTYGGIYFPNVKNDRIKVLEHEIPKENLISFLRQGTKLWIHDSTKGSVTKRKQKRVF